jgi:ATP-binding cassette subfamily B protein
MKANTKLTLKIYWQHLRKYKVSFFITLVLLIGGSIVSNFVPLYYAKFFNILSNGAQKNEQFKDLLNVLFLIAVFSFSRYFLWRATPFITTGYVSQIQEKDLYATCFAHLHRHSFSFFNGNFVGSLVKRVHRFVRSFINIYDNVVWYLLGLCVDVVTIFIILTKRNIWLGVVILVWTIVFLIINWFLAQYKLKYDILYSEADSKASGFLADTVTNNVNVKLFNGFNRELLEYDKLTEKVKKLRKIKSYLDSIFEAVQGFLMIVLEIGMFYIAVFLWKKNIITVGDFVLIQAYVLHIFNQVWGFSRTVRFIYESLADAEEMTVTLNTPHEIEDVKNAKQLKVTEGVVSFENVGFYYHETRKIFDNLDFRIEPNQKIALVGPSGSGKSTIIKLLLRMHDITNGKISVDEQNIAKVTQDSLWKNISLVPQDPILFHRSLLENIRYGKPEASEEEVRQAARLAHCDEFISAFPEKYETHVGERGVKLSGGERQRVAIARAILRNAPILVLDEATSSLDSESESLIQDALNNLMKNKTVIVIAHRLSTIMTMDRIIVLKSGKIVEEGTHDELIKKSKGLYKKLWKFQAGGFIS